MTLGNMRHLGVQRLVAFCLNCACRHQGLVDLSKYADDVEVPSFAREGGVRQVRLARPAHRPANELERTAAERELDR